MSESSGVLQRSIQNTLGKGSYSTVKTASVTPGIAA